MNKHSVGVVATLADRPEKAFLLKISLLGVFGKIASWAADIRPDVLADCSKCFDVRVNALIRNSESKFPGSTCKNCCQWDLNSASHSITSVHPPEYYPKKCCPNSPPPPVGRDVNVRFIKPVKQTFDWLISAVNFAAHNVREGILKKRVMYAYLQTVICILFFTV